MTRANCSDRTHVRSRHRTDSFLLRKSASRSAKAGERSTLEYKHSLVTVLFKESALKRASIAAGVRSPSNSSDSFG